MKQKNEMRGESWDLAALFDYVYWHQTLHNLECFGFINSFSFSGL